jgi:PAS domain S-box-containing protein
MLVFGLFGLRLNIQRKALGLIGDIGFAFQRNQSAAFAFLVVGGVRMQGTQKRPRKRPRKAVNRSPKPRESEGNFRLLVEGVIDYAIFMLSPEGNVVSWNTGAERIKGYKARQIIGKHFSVFYPPHDREEGLPAKALEIARKDKHFIGEGWRVRKDGSRFFASVVIDPIYEQRKLIGYAAITQDITERHKALSDLNESESKFRMLVNGVTDYALYMLSPTGVVSNWNAGGQRIKGYLPDEIIGENFSKFYTPADRAAGKPQRALKIAQETGHYVEEGWRVRKDGTFFWASVVIDPIYDDEGRLAGFAKITRDISERRDAQQKLEQMQKQLAESQKMDALGQLTGGVAHDFNNLLMIISGNLARIKKELSSEKGLKALAAIEMASQRAASLTSQLLTFARRQSVNPQPVDVVQRITSLWEVLNSGIGRAVALQLDIDEHVWPVIVDVTEFETAIVNLVVNARDAMPDGGTVTIKAFNDPDRKQVAICVIDTGVGIPADVINKVFEPFFTTKPVGKGTGLGLSQVHGFAHQAGGTIEIESTLSQGTRVCIRLPRALLVETKEGEQVGGRGSATILLVEDNPDVADASTGLLEQLGYTVRWVADAETALREIDKDGIDVVFSDIVMPGKMDGVQLAKAIKERRPLLPILLATGYSQGARGVGGDFPVIRKPYQLHELGQELAKLTARPVSESGSLHPPSAPAA